MTEVIEQQLSWNVRRPVDFWSGPTASKKNIGIVTDASDVIAQAASLLKKNVPIGSFLDEDLVRHRDNLKSSLEQLAEWSKVETPATSEWNAVMDNILVGMQCYDMICKIIETKMRNPNGAKIRLTEVFTPPDGFKGFSSIAGGLRWDYLFNDIIAQFNNERGRTKSILIAGPVGSGIIDVARALRMKVESSLNKKEEKIVHIEQDVVTLLKKKTRFNVNTFLQDFRKRNELGRKDTIFVYINNFEQFISESLQESVMSLLSSQDLESSYSQNRLFIIAATSQPWIIPESIQNKFDLKAYCPLPDEDMIYETLSRWVKVSGPMAFKTQLKKLINYGDDNFQEYKIEPPVDSNGRIGALYGLSQQLFDKNVDYDTINGYMSSVEKEAAARTARFLSADNQYSLWIVYNTYIGSGKTTYYKQNTVPYALVKDGILEAIENIRFDTPVNECVYNFGDFISSMTSDHIYGCFGSKREDFPEHATISPKIVLMKRVKTKTVEWYREATISWKVVGGVVDWNVPVVVKKQEFVKDFTISVTRCQIDETSLKTNLSVVTKRNPENMSRWLAFLETSYRRKMPPAQYFDSWATNDIQTKAKFYPITFRVSGLEERHVQGWLEIIKTMLIKDPSNPFLRNLTPQNAEAIKNMEISPNADIGGYEVSANVNDQSWLISGNWVTISDPLSNKRRFRMMNYSLDSHDMAIAERQSSVKQQINNNRQVSEEERLANELKESQKNAAKGSSRPQSTPPTSPRPPSSK